MNRWMLALLPLTILACNPDETGETNVEEVITTVELTFTPDEGDAVVATWVDLEDGNPTIDDIMLAADTDYELTVRFLNELEDPAENITEEIEEEDDEHQIFFDGSALDTMTIAYGDMDGGGLPVGLTNDVMSGAAATGDLTVQLQHLPAEDGTAVKVAGLEDDIANLPGDADAVAEFPVTVE